MVRVFILAGGLCGAAGVALSAMAAHAGGPNLSTAASFLLMHAPAFLAVGLAGGGNRFLTLAATLLLAGVTLFCGDLLARDLLGSRLFPMAAPAGGILAVTGWLAIAASSLASIHRSAR